jgi:tRNA pseudouridine38-40 synthase
MSRRVLLRLAYDGTEYLGYQIQRTGRTIQGEVERALARLHDHPVATVSAGRTDTGVHARAQYVSFVTDRDSIPILSFPAALNSHLPHDIRALSAWERPDSFHARFDALRRHYRYHLYVAPYVVPYRDRYAWRIAERPDLTRLNTDAAALVGRHDFATFTIGAAEQGSTVRTVEYADVRAVSADGIEFAICADGFLQRMVRSIVGSLVERERKRVRGIDQERSIEDLLARRDRSCAGTSAPPHGLFLHEVEYREDA